MRLTGALRTTVLAGLVLAGLVTLTACGSSSSPADSVGPGSGGGATVHLAEPANGTTVLAHVGDRLVVTLHSTYWSLAAPSGGAVTVGVAPSVSPGGAQCRRPPGTGCGAVTATYDVTAVGNARLTASRRYCGEAMRCVGGKGHWAVSVTVS